MTNNTTNTTNNNVNGGMNMMELTINGVTVKMTIDCNGIPTFVNSDGNTIDITMINPTINITTESNTTVEEQIENSEFVADRNGYRRWIMAQMFKAMNYTCSNGSGYDYFYKKVKPYNYQWKTTLDEIKYLAENYDTVDDIRDKFFTKPVVDEMIDDHVEKMYNYLNGKIFTTRNGAYVGVERTITTHGTRRRTYAFLNGRTKEDILKCLDVVKLNAQIVKTKSNPVEYIVALEKFLDICDEILILPKYTEKSKAWFDAFKGEGAYYTLQNMIANHGCRIKEGRLRLNSQHSMDKIVNFMKDEYEKGNGYKLFGILKKCIEDNNFDFNQRMSEVYSSRNRF